MPDENKGTILRAQLAQVPYLDIANVGGRVVQMMPLYDGERWWIWVPGPDGTMIKLSPVEHGRGDYVAKAEASATDLHVSFIEMVWQRLSFPAVAAATDAISEDIRNLATALAKIDHFWDERERIGHGVAEFVRTEIEYVLVVARSLLDHVHEVVVGIWENVRLLDEEQNRRKNSRRMQAQLSKVCFKDRQVRAPEDLVERHALPPLVAQFYCSVGMFLGELRDVRDGIVHEGRSAGSVFVTDRGFGIAHDGRLARVLGRAWLESHRYNEHVLSLRPLLAHLCLGSIYLCETATSSFAKCIELPPPIAPGYRVYTRAEHGAALLRAQEVHRGGDPWWGSSR